MCHPPTPSSPAERRWCNRRINAHTPAPALLEACDRKNALCFWYFERKGLGICLDFLCHPLPYETRKCAAVVRRVYFAAGCRKGLDDYDFCLEPQPTFGQQTQTKFLGLREIRFLGGGLVAQGHGRTSEPGKTESALDVGWASSGNSTGAWSYWTSPANAVLNGPLFFLRECRKFVRVIAR